MKPVKILQVFTILNRGGAETNMMNYYQEIDRTQFQIDFVVHRQEIGAYEEKIKNLGGKIFRLPPLHPTRIKEYKKAVQLFFDKNPDYQIIHGQCSELGLFIYQEAKRRNIPVIIAHAHNSKMDWDKKAIFRILWKHEIRKYINSYFTCGKEAAVWLFGNKLSSEAYQMNNAIKTENFAFNNYIRQKMRSELDAENTHNFVHIGRFNVQKNHKVLVEIFAQIVKLQPESQLFLIGDGDLLSEIKLKVLNLNLEGKVKFLGLRDDVPDILQAMDVFLFPSLFEGLPVALVEAQASGVFCAVSDAIPAESFLIPSNISVLSLKKSPAFWAENIISKSNEFERRDVSDLIESNGYDIRANVKKLEEKYLQLYNKFS